MLVTCPKCERQVAEKALQKFFLCWRDKKRRYVGSTGKRRLHLVHTKHCYYCPKCFNKLTREL